MSPAAKEIGKNPFRWAEGFQFSPCVLARGTLVFVSAQGGVDADGNLVGSDDFEAQLRQTYANLSQVLEAQGASLDDIVMIRSFLKRKGDYETLVRVRGETFSAPYPAITSYVVADFLIDGVLLELDAVAVLPGGAGE